MALAWPGTLTPPEQADVWIEHVEQVNASPFSGLTEVVPRYGRWRGIMTWAAMPQIQSDAVLAVLASARGSVFSLAVPLYRYSKFIGGGVTAGGTLTNAPAAGTFSITTDRTGLAAGDYVQLGTATPRVHRVVGVSGSTYTVDPELRKAYSVGAAVITLADVSVLHCAMHTAGPLGPAPVFASRLGVVEGQLIEGLTVEFVEALRRGDL